MSFSNDLWHTPGHSPQPSFWFKAATLLLALLTTHACLPGPDGCNMLDDDNECVSNTSLCTTKGLAHCVEDGCGTHWSTQKCRSDAPHCVTIDDAWAQCSAGPDCASTEACTKAGRCAEDSSGCIATELGCKDSEDCRAVGKCGLGITECVYTEQGCGSSEECRQSGRCGYAGWDGCVITEAGCRDSGDCRDAGMCTLGEWRCTETAEGCANSRLCRDAGRCSLEQWGCE